MSIKLTNPARCIICGELIGTKAYHGGKVKHGGYRFIHQECWAKEQAERKQKIKNKENKNV